MEQQREALHILLTWESQPPDFITLGPRIQVPLGQHTACDSFFITFFCGKDTIKMGSIRRIQERKEHRRIRSHAVVLTDPLRAMQALGCCGFSLNG